MRLFSLIPLLLCTALAQAREPQGPEFRVNTTTTGNQGSGTSGANGSPPAPVAVAARDDGGFVVVWNQENDNAQSVAGRVNAQRYNPDGTPEGGEFSIEIGATSELDVAMAPDGAFVAAWRDDISNHIEARRYTASGQPAGDAFIVSDTHTTRYAGAPCPRASYISVRVAMAADGAFAVLWTCAQGSANFPSGAVFVRHYDGDGIASDGYVTVGNFTTGSGFLGGLHADVLMGDNGYQVIYQGPCRIAPGSDTFSAPCAQRFNSIGESQGDPLPLGPQAPFGQVSASRLQAARDAAGNFAVVWINAESRVALGRFEPGGAPTASPFVFAAGETLRNLPAVAASGSGDPRFVTAYQRATAADANRSEILAREFGLSSSDTASFIAHSNGSADERSPSAALDADGDYILAWGRLASGSTDVFARRFGGAQPNPGLLRFVVLTPDDPHIFVGEGNGSVVVTVERVNGSAGAASAQVKLSNNFSMGEPLLAIPQDISASSQPAFLNWADGESGPQSVSFSIVDDALDEAEESATLSLDAVSGAGAGTPEGARLVVIDNDDPPEVGFTTPDATASEGGAPLVLTAALSAPSGKDISLAYALSGTALNQQDYTVSPLSPVTIPAGQTEARITVTPVDDTVEEPEESILVDLDIGSSVNVAAGERVRQIIALAASDTALRADLEAQLFTPDAPVRTGTLFTVETAVRNLGPNFAPGVTSQIRLSAGRIDGFFVPAGVSCTRSNLDRTLSCNVDGVAVGDAKGLALLEVEAPAEAGEFTVTHDVFGGPGDPVSSNNFVSRTVNVRPPNPGVVGFQLTRSEHEEPFESETSVVIGLSRSAEGEGAASVGFRVLAEGGTVPATAGTDFRVITNGRLSLPAGGSSASIEIDLDADLEPENFEGLVLELIDPQGTVLDPERSRHEVVILDNDGGPGDRKPDAFSPRNSAGQTSQSGVAAGTAVTTEPFTVSGLGGPAEISVTTGSGGAGSRAKSAGSVQYSINGGDFTASPGTVNNGDVVRLRVFASATPGATVTATLTIGGVSRQFSVTTAAAAPVTVRSSGGGLGAGWLLVLALAAAGRGKSHPRPAR